MKNQNNKNLEKLGIPFYQKLYGDIGNVFLGVVLIGQLFDSFVNAQSIITTSRAIIFSCVICSLWLISEFYLRLAPLKWYFPLIEREKRFQEYRIKGLGRGTRMKIIGAVLLIWVPSLVGAFKSDEEYISSLFLQVGSYELSEDETYYLLYGLDNIDAPDNVLFLPFSLGNQSKKSIKNISLSAWFPGHPEFVIPNSTLEQEMFGSLRVQMLRYDPI